VSVIDKILCSTGGIILTEESQCIRRKTYLRATLSTTNPNELAWDLNRATEVKGREVGVCVIALSVLTTWLSC